MLVCFGKCISTAVTDSHLANLPRDFILLGVSTAFSLQAVMFKPILQSRRSTGAVHGLPRQVFHGRCVRNQLKSKKPFAGEGVKSTGSETAWQRGGLLLATLPAARVGVMGVCWLLLASPTDCLQRSP